MTSVDPMNPGDDMWRDLEAQYWETVSRTLEVVFHAPPRLAEQFKRRMSDSSPLERSLILHENPLYVAADLAGEQVTEDHLERFERHVLAAEGSSER